MSRYARLDEASFSAAPTKRARKLRKRVRDLDEGEDEEERGEGLPRWKMIAVFGAIGICFAMLFPSLFGPLLSTLFGWRRSESAPAGSTHHPAMDRGGAPRPPGGPPHRPGPGRMPQAEVPQSGGRGGMFTWMLPIYTVGVMGFLIYTLIKMNRRKKKRPRTRYEDELDELGVGVSGDEDEEEDESDRDGLGHGNLRSIQSRLRETESAMSKILEQLEEIAQNATPNSGGRLTEELLASYPPEKLRETERNLEELSRLNELRSRQRREIAEMGEEVEDEDEMDEDDATLIDADNQTPDHPTYAQVVKGPTSEQHEAADVKQRRVRPPKQPPTHPDGTPLSYAEVVAAKDSNPADEHEDESEDEEHSSSVHQPPVHNDGTPFTYAEVVAKDSTSFDEPPVDESPIVHQVPPVHDDGTPFSYAEVVKKEPTPSTGTQPPDQTQESADSISFANSADPTVLSQRSFIRAKRKRPFVESAPRTPDAEDRAKLEEQRLIVENLAKPKNWAEVVKQNLDDQNIELAWTDESKTEELEMLRQLFPGLRKTTSSTSDTKPTTSGKSKSDVEDHDSDHEDPGVDEENAPPGLPAPAADLSDEVDEGIIENLDDEENGDYERQAEMEKSMEKLLDSPPRSVAPIGTSQPANVDEDDAEDEKSPSRPSQPKSAARPRRSNNQRRRRARREN